MGGQQTSLQRVWSSMRYRCNTPSSSNYKDYGGRGIKVCPEWRSFSAFASWAMEHGYRRGLYLDRIDNDKGYSPDNCRFVDARTSMNNRRTVIHVSAFGETKSISEWSRDPRCPGVKPTTLIQRIQAYNWDVETAILTPTGHKPYRLHAHKP